MSYLWRKLGINWVFYDFFLFNCLRYSLLFQILSIFLAYFIGGGENGDSFKLENADSAHIEICRVGSFNEAWGGVPLPFLERIMSDGTIKIPVMAVLPTGVIENSDMPPEVEVRFDLKKIKVNLDDEIRRIISNNRKIEHGDGDSGCESADFENLANWQLRFVHNQLFHILENSNRFCPGAHHMTIVRKASWKNNNAKREYFKNCCVIQEEWEKNGPKLLTPVIPVIPAIPENAYNGNGAITGAISLPIDDELIHPNGIYLFKDRKTIIKYFKPNFLPPYDTNDKIEIIRSVLAEKWDENYLQWVPENI